ncbi:MAG: alpha/beta hydrolase, partial [Streptomyces albidoflavus]
MTSFDASPQFNVWRTLLALAIVLVMLATSGWTAARHQRGDTNPLQRALNAWSDGRFQGKPLPDADAPSAELAGFFASLSRAQRLDLAERYPLAVGNMNGAPPKLRYRANRIALEEAVGVERERTRDHRLSTEGRQEADRRIHRFLSLLHPKRHVLAFDPTGRGRVAEVFGNLDRAARVSVVVPGVDTDVLTYERTYRTFSAPAGMAKSLYKAERAQRESSLPRSASGAPRVAVIAWADYTSPAGI